MRPVSEIDYPKTAEEWWALVEANKQVLLGLVMNFHPVYRRSNSQYPITAALAERVCEAVRKQLVEGKQEDPQRRFERYLVSHDSDLVVLLNEVWFGMPESDAVHFEPGFAMLCDLCSEEYVLDEADPDVKVIDVQSSEVD